MEYYCTCVSRYIGYSLHVLIFVFRLLEDDLPLSIYDKKNDKKMSKMQVDDWNEIEVKAISEILVAYEVKIRIGIFKSLP